MEIQEEKSQHRVYGKHHEHMLWAARILSLGPWSIILFVGLCTRISLMVQGSDIRFEYYYLLFFFSILPGVIAWRWQLHGGVLLIIMSCGLFGYNIYEIFTFQGTWITGSAFTAFYIIPGFALVTLTGGILHLVYWYKEKRIKLSEGHS